MRKIIAHNVPVTLNGKIVGEADITIDGVMVEYKTGVIKNPTEKEKVQFT
jgi:hypothetical protein